MSFHLTIIITYKGGKMLNLFKTFLGSFVLILIFIGCEENTVNPDVNDNNNLRLEKVVEKVTGSGHFTTADGDLRTFSFTARKNEVGVDGRWVRVRRVDGVNVHSQGVVTCFTIIGDQAWLGGYATQGLLSEPPNNEVAWRVVDNGQGNNSPPDRISMQFVGAGPGFAESYCSATPDAPPLNDIEEGNIKIH